MTTPRHPEALLDEIHEVEQAIAELERRWTIQPDERQMAGLEAWLKVLEDEYWGHGDFAEEG